MIKKKIFLLIFSILFSLTLIELILLFSGKYNNLTKNNLKPSLAIYERANSSTQKHKHPDIDYTITNFFDADGVKNFDKKNTSHKKNIIGIFGDSFVENIAVDKKFEYSNLLNQVMINNTVVNYGVGGYSADQVFIRYLKYKDHDIKHVFFLLMPGDQGFSTDSIFKDDGTYVISKPKLNFFYQLLGKLNITYFMIDVYYSLKSLFSENYTHTKKESYNSVLANKIYKKFYSKGLKKCEYDIFDENCMKNLSNLLMIFKKEAENNGAQFHVLIYPNKDHFEYFDKIMRLKNIDLNYFYLEDNLESGSVINGKKISFINDAHWNEYGSYEFAKNLLNLFVKLGINIKNENFNVNINDIEVFYKKN
jgi:hypothetical protein